MNLVWRDLLGSDPVEELTTNGTVLTVPLDARENEDGIRVLLGVPVTAIAQRRGGVQSRPQAGPTHRAVGIGCCLQRITPRLCPASDWPGKTAASLNCGDVVASRHLATKLLPIHGQKESIVQ
jgi:hypothetical protein